MTRRAVVLVLGLAVTAATGCTYDPTFQLTCDQEGARDGDRVCKDGVWVTAGTDTALPDDAGMEETGPDDGGVVPEDTGDVDMPRDTGADVTTDACIAEGDDAFCDRLVKNCGAVTAPDNCGTMRTVDCGECTLPATCGGGGTDNVCGNPGQTDEEFCAMYDAECGELTADDMFGDERTTNCGGCGQNEACNLGTHTCDCANGYVDSAGTCIDIDECSSGAAGCDQNASCTNTPGSYECACNDGWDGDGMTCADIDECANGTNDCDANASCRNIPGAFECQCNPGYTGDGKTCTATPDPIVSIHTVEITLADGESSGSSTTFGPIESTNAVPFASLRTSASTLRDMTVDLTLADDKVDYSRPTASGSVTMVITVVEFDPAEVDVFSGTFDDASTDPFPRTVDPSNAFALFSYSIDSAQEDKNDLMFSGRLTANSLELGRDGNNGGVSGTYWVAESQSGAFTAQHVSGSIAAGETTSSLSIAPVDITKSFVVYSYRTTESGVNGANGHVSCRLVATDAVTCSRDGNSGEITNLEVQVVELASGRVRRNQSSLLGTATTGTATLGAQFDTSRSMGWAGQTGAHGACQTNETSNGGAPTAFATVDLTDQSTITVERDPAAGGAARCTWEAVEW